MMPDPAFALTQGEKMHPLWLRLKAHMEERLRIMREKNDDPQMNEIQTAAQRGHIRCLKGLIDLGDDRPLTGE